MVAPTIASMQQMFRDSLGVRLYPLPRKRIMFRGVAGGGKDVVVAMPESKIHDAGYGWVDINERQRSELKKGSAALVVFRLADGLWYSVDFNALDELFQDDLADCSAQAGKHWKLRLWPSRLEMMRGGASIHWQANDHVTLSRVLNKQAKGE